MKTDIIFLLGLFAFTANKNAPAQTQTLVGITAVRANDFLNSMGGNTHMDQRRATSAEVISMLHYTGIRNFRERATASDAIAVHNATGAKVSVVMGPRDFHTAIPKLQQIASAGALLAIEGPNEPNNEPVTYNGQKTDRNTTFIPVAQFQRDLYATVKADSILGKYPVFASSTAGGAEPDNVGLQFLTIPAGAGTLMPDGTKYADYVNIHNYAKFPSDFADNVVWNSFATDTTPTYEGMYKSYSNTWKNHFKGYPISQLPTLPRVSTETGYDWPKSTLTDSQKGKLVMHCFLDGYKRGYAYTIYYQMKDVNEGQGLYTSDGTPKIGATYIHNFTTILSDTSSSFTPDKVNYSIPGEHAIMHDMLMQKSNGKFELVVWIERIKGSDNVNVKLGKTYRSVKVYNPTMGTSAIQTLRNVSSVRLTMSDHPMIIEINN
jgi:hypothetical protein